MIRQFYQDGYIIIPNATPPTIVDNAIREINQDLATSSDPSKREKKIWSTKATTDLFNANPTLKRAVGELLGDEKKVPYLLGAQVALRFPGTLCLPGSFIPVPYWTSVWHIDGLPSPDSGIAVGSIKNFTLLVGVCLQDIPADLSGNLVVYPRSHFVMEAYFRQHGFEAAKQGLTQLPSLPLAQPHQVKCRRGDVVVCHYSLCHSIAPNCCKDIRYMCYFRVNMRSDGFHPDPMLNIWTDLCPQLQTLAASSPPPAIQLSPIPSNPSSAAAAASSSSSSSSTAASAGAGSRPGYIDAVAKSTLASQLAADSASHTELAAAERLFDAGDHRGATAVLVRFADERPHDLLLQLRASVCQTVNTPAMLRAGEDRLRRLAATAPQFGHSYIFLGRNLQRQADELPSPPGRDAGQLKQEAERLVVQGLLECAPCDDVVIQGLEVLRDLNCPSLTSDVIPRVLERYPALAPKVDAIAVSVSSGVGPLWQRGKQWLASPDPKDVQAGINIFREICTISPMDYWAHVLYGACTLGQAAHNRNPQQRKAGMQQAVEVLKRARDIDPTFPHGYTVAAQALEALGRPDEAVDLIAHLLDRSDIQLNEPDHYQKIVEGLQVCASALLPHRQAQFEAMRLTAMTLWPCIAPQLASLQGKADKNCVVM